MIYASQNTVNFEFNLPLNSTECFLLRFTPQMAEVPLKDMVLQEKEEQKVE